MSQNNKRYPQCGAETDVVRCVADYRHRRCRNPRCAHEYGTREEPVTLLEFRRIRSQAGVDVYLEILATGSQNQRTAS